MAKDPGIGYRMVATVVEAKGKCNAQNAYFARSINDRNDVLTIFGGFSYQNKTKLDIPIILNKRVYN